MNIDFPSFLLFLQKNPSSDDILVRLKDSGFCCSVPPTSVHCLILSMLASHNRIDAFIPFLLSCVTSSSEKHIPPSQSGQDQRNWSEVLGRAFYVSCLSNRMESAQLLLPFAGSSIERSFHAAITNHSNQILALLLPYVSSEFLEKSLDISCLVGNIDAVQCISARICVGPSHQILSLLNGHENLSHYLKDFVLLDDVRRHPDFMHMPATRKDACYRIYASK